MRFLSKPVVIVSICIAVCLVGLGGLVAPYVIQANTGGAPKLDNSLIQGNGTGNNETIYLNTIELVATQVPASLYWNIPNLPNLAHAKWPYGGIIIPIPGQIDIYKIDGAKNSEIRLVIVTDLYIIILSHGGT